MDASLAVDLKTLRRAEWDDTQQVVEIANAITDYLEEVDKRLERLDKVEGILNKLDAEGKTDVLKHFEVLKSA